MSMKTDYMFADATLLLCDIGEQLNKNVYPRIYDGGVVMPSDSTQSSIIMGMEKENVTARSGSRKSKTTPKKRTAGWERPTKRSWQTSAPTPVFSSDLQETYEKQLDKVCEFYPNTQVWLQEDGLWLFTESILLDGLQKGARFLTCIPFSRALSARSWGFWADLRWIGPRHTNFPDGSICAFYDIDEVWNIGDSIISLLDLYTLWALRHLHLNIFGRWPGQQVAFHPYERILEFQDGESCGCGVTDKKYEDCCKSHDFSSDIIANAVNYSVFFEGGLRSPPDDIKRFVLGRGEPPQIKEIFSIP